MNETLARRNMLGAAFTTIAAGALSAFTAAPAFISPADPVFVVLAARDAASGYLARVSAETAGDEGPEAEARWAAGDRRLATADHTLRATIPTTLAGLAALARHYAATASDPDADGLTHLVEALNALARAAPS